MTSGKSAKLQHQQVLEVHAVEYETAISDSIEKLHVRVFLSCRLQRNDVIFCATELCISQFQQDIFCVVHFTYRYVIHLSLTCQLCTLSTIGCMAKPLHIGLFQMNCSIACKCGSVCTY